METLLSTIVSISKKQIENHNYSIVCLRRIIDEIESNNSDSSYIQTMLRYLRRRGISCVYKDNKFLLEDGLEVPKEIIDSVQKKVCE